MKYEIDDAVKLVEERSRKLKVSRLKRSNTILGSLSAFMLVAVLAAMFRFSGYTTAGGGYSPYGAFMLSDAAGGYILVGVISFVAAVVITLCCIRIAKNRRKLAEEEAPEKVSDAAGGRN